jgi:hypothetical protein
MTTKSNFVSKLFISIGQTHAYFTLRETYEHISYITSGGSMGGAVLNGVYQGEVQIEIRSHHCFNLSQDADEAVAKAKEYADANGFELCASANAIKEEMRDIKRSNAEQLEKRAAEQLARDIAWDKEEQEEKNRKLDMIEQGLYPVGQYYKMEFRSAPVSYINWLVESNSSYEEGSVIKAVSDAVKACCGDLIFPVADTHKKFGEIGVRSSVDVTVVKRIEYSKPCYGGYGMELGVITQMVTSEGALLVCFSTAFKSVAGDKLSIKATVKNQGYYKEQMQTIVQRIAINKPKK